MGNYIVTIFNGTLPELMEGEAESVEFYEHNIAPAQKLAEYLIGKGLSVVIEPVKENDEG